eukprot:351732-Chlamydomonas_euryale.AAC.10
MTLFLSACVRPRLFSRNCTCKLDGLFRQQRRFRLLDSPGTQDSPGRLLKGVLGILSSAPKLLTRTNFTTSPSRTFTQGIGGGKLPEAGLPTMYAQPGKVFLMRLPDAVLPHHTLSLRQCCCLVRGVKEHVRLAATYSRLVRVRDQRVVAAEPAPVKLDVRDVVATRHVADVAHAPKQLEVAAVVVASACRGRQRLGGGGAAADALPQQRRGCERSHVKVSKREVERRL